MQLKVSFKKLEPEVIQILKPGFRKSLNRRSIKFTWDEFERTISSAFRDKYQYCHAYSSKRTQKILSALGLFNLQCEQVPEITLKFSNPNNLQCQASILARSTVKGFLDPGLEPEQSNHADMLLERIRAKNIAKFGDGFYAEGTAVCNEADELLEEIRKRNLERFVDGFYSQ